MQNVLGNMLRNGLGDILGDILLEFFLVVFVFPVVNDLANRGPRIGGNLYQVQAPLLGKPDRLMRVHYTQLCITMDNTHLRCPDPLIDTITLTSTAIRLLSWPSDNYALRFVS